MKYLPYDHQPNVALLSAVLAAVRQVVAGLFPPMVSRPPTAGGSDRRRQLVAYLLLILGLLVQGVLILVACYLIDLAISLMELWAELARKHLELTM